MSGADRVIRQSTAGSVLAVAAEAAVATYEHAYDLERVLGTSAPDGTRSTVAAILRRLFASAREERIVPQILR